MATIRERTRRSGDITYSVQWREGGARTGRQCSEPFADEVQAKSFKIHVEAAGHRWPDGWIKGRGFVREGAAAPAPEPATGAVETFGHFAHRYVDDILTGVEPRTRGDYHTMIDQQFAAFADLPVDAPRSADVSRWVNLQEAGIPGPAGDDDWVKRPARAKTLANRHGLLYSLFHAAVQAGLRTDNPCSGTTLPRTDDEIDEEMVFLEHAEYRLLRDCMAAICDGDVVDLLDVMVGTGLRWGEVSALQVQDLKLEGDAPTLQVRRAWKRQDDNTFRLGRPKTRKSRRTLILSPSLARALRARTAGADRKDFVFRTAEGHAWRHCNFYSRRWKKALAAAEKKGLAKHPRPHDLRHTHVAWLIEKNVPLPKIQQRLGHESIVTTIDRYGHLAMTMDSEVAAAVEEAMSGPAGPPRLSLAG